MDALHPTWGGIDPRAAQAVFTDLTTYLGKPIEAIAEEFWQHREHEDVNAQERVATATAEAVVMDYYQTTPLYLYELSYWEACHDKQRWFRVVARACRRFGLRRVLDYGGGIGGVSLFLQLRNIVVCDYLDVAGLTFEYAKWRFARRSLPVQTIDVLHGWPTGPYDAVIAWDVLEHLFDLEGTIGNIAGILRPGGWLLDKSTFGEEGGDHHVHLAKYACYRDVSKFNEMAARYGFLYVGQLKPDRLSRFLGSLGFHSTVAGIRISPRVKHGGNFLIHERQHA
jgi:2-polyprenyl-3-methyl-5-hydroxy-6-metoxy-1,4-benzoquinol methylase